MRFATRAKPVTGYEGNVRIRSRSDLARMAPVHQDERWIIAVMSAPFDPSPATTALATL
jgi:hypothetical protein